jgi:hypothetical protein
MENTEYRDTGYDRERIKRSLDWVRKGAGSLQAINASMDLRPDVVSGGGLSGCVLTLCLLLCVGQNWAQNVDVESAGTLGSGELEPEDKEGLEGIIEGEIVKDRSQGERFKEVEESENDPVGEPLDVILVSGCLDSLEREISWEEPSDEVRGRGSEGVNEDENRSETDRTQNKEGLGDLSTLLKVFEDRVLVELFVELCVIVFSLRRGLNVRRVVLDVCSCRHCRLAFDIREICFL